MNLLKFILNTNETVKKSYVINVCACTFGSTNLNNLKNKYRALT